MDLELEIKLQERVTPYIKAHPERKRAIMEEVEMCVEEIEDGGSFSDELDKMEDSIKEICK